jgi:hypothetical protein
MTVLPSVRARAAQGIEAIGVLLVAATTAAPAIVQLAAVAVRDAAFTGMGLSLIRRARHPGVTVRRFPTTRPYPDLSEGHAASAIDLYWIPLGAGGHVVRLSGRIYESIVALRQHRKPQNLYHAALEVLDHGERYTIEMAPVWNDKSPKRGDVCQGPVGLRILGRLRAFQYEVRCWHDGHIPDIADAVASPLRVSTDAGTTSYMLRIVREVPPLTWGKDELRAGEMWNSNSLVAWLLARAGLATDTIRPPAHGRAPGWTAGLTLAARQAATQQPVQSLPRGVSARRVRGGCNARMDHCRVADTHSYDRCGLEVRESRRSSEAAAGPDRSPSSTRVSPEGSVCGLASRSLRDSWGHVRAAYLSLPMTILAIAMSGP